MPKQDKIVINKGLKKVSTDVSPYGHQHCTCVNDHNVYT